MIVMFGKILSAALTDCTQWQAELFVGYTNLNCATNTKYHLLHSSNTVFASADAAYVLAYSIIMLTTDLHNSQVHVSAEYVASQLHLHCIIKDNSHFLSLVYSQLHTNKNTTSISFLDR